MQDWQRELGRFVGKFKEIPSATVPVLFGKTLTGVQERS
jgi:hypothetical protein